MRGVTLENECLVSSAVKNSRIFVAINIDATEIVITYFNWLETKWAGEEFAARCCEKRR